MGSEGVSSELSLNPSPTCAPLISPLKMKVSTITLPVLASLATANPVELTERQSCPPIHIFGARETTVPQGYGTSQGLVNMVAQAYPGATREAIVYPACGGQSQCGGVSYENSARQGTAAVVRAVTTLNQRCPDTKIVLIGYSQGGQIMDGALCGGAGATLTGAPLAAVKAAIFMGDPMYNQGLPYNVGTCRARGVCIVLCICRYVGGADENCATVCRPTQRLPVLTGQPGNHPVVLRLDRPVLLHWQRCQLASAVCQQVRAAGLGFHPSPAGCCVSWPWLGIKRGSGVQGDYKQ